MAAGLVVMDTQALEPEVYFSLEREEWSVVIC